MRTIDRSMRICDIMQFPEFQEVSPYILFNWDMTDKRVISGTIGDLEGSGWSPGSMVYGFHRLQARVEDPEKPVVCRVYPESDWADDPTKRDVNIIHFPPKEDTGKPFVMVCSGGGYQRVCSAGESYGMAARLNELGYHAFAVTYRVDQPKLFPKPMEDLAAAIRYVLNNASEFGLKNTSYVVTGCSAGGNLTALWGTKEHGWACYDLPRPVAMFPVYAALDFSMARYSPIATMLFGEDDPELPFRYDVSPRIDGDYPPCYLVCCKDDPLVPYSNSELYAQKLQEAGVAHMLEMGDHGGHGFGEGQGTDVEGWMYRAVEFLERL